MRTFIRLAAIIVAGVLSVIVAQRLMRQAYKETVEGYSVVPVPDRQNKSA